MNMCRFLSQCGASIQVISSHKRDDSTVFRFRVVCTCDYFTTDIDLRPNRLAGGSGGVIEEFQQVGSEIRYLSSVDGPEDLVAPLNKARLKGTSK